MKKHFSFSGLVLIIALIVMQLGCKKDNAPVSTIPPTIAVNNDVIITTLGNDFYMEADLADDAGLKSFTFRYDDWYLYNTVSLADLGNPKTYHIKYKFKMPDTAANKIHSINLTATNTGNATKSTQFKILLNADLPQMYLIESTDPAKLTSDLFGVPALVTKTSSYNYETVYYSAAANSTVWFIPSKTTIKPFMYGIDPADAKKLSGDYAKALPIVLPSIGYYKISFNTLNLSFNVQTLPKPDPALAYAQTAFVGRGFYDYPNMNWQNALPDIVLLDKDPANPYRFTKTVKLGTPPGATYTTTQFIITTNNGWSDFWRFDTDKDPNFTVFGGGVNTDIPITTTPVTYKVTFDSYTNRCKFERQ
jgi:hypothetical protein